MKLRAVRKLRAARATLHVLTSGALPIPPTAALSAFIGQLQEAITQLEATLNRSGVKTSAPVAERNRQVELAIKAAYDIASRAYSFANTVEKPGLAEQVRVGRTKFKAGSVETRLALCQSIHDSVKPHVGQAGDFGLTPELLDVLQSYITKATAASTGPRSTAAERKAANGQLDKDVEALDVLLGKKIDPLMAPLADTHPEFFNNYKAARMIVDSRGGSRTPKSDDKNPPSVGNPPPKPTGS